MGVVIESNQCMGSLSLFAELTELLPPTGLNVKIKALQQNLWLKDENQNHEIEIGSAQNE